MTTQAQAAYNSPLLEDGDVSRGPMRSGRFEAAWTGVPIPVADDGVPRSVSSSSWIPAQVGDVDVDDPSDDDSTGDEGDEEQNELTTITFDVTNDSERVIALDFYPNNRDPNRSKSHMISAVLTKFNGLQAFEWKPSTASPRTHKTITLKGTKKATSRTKKHIRRILGQNRMKAITQGTQPVQTSSVAHYYS